MPGLLGRAHGECYRAYDELARAGSARGQAATTSSAPRCAVNRRLARRLAWLRGELGERRAPGGFGLDHVLAGHVASDATAWDVPRSGGLCTVSPNTSRRPRRRRERLFTGGATLEAGSLQHLLVLLLAHALAALLDSDPIARRTLLDQRSRTKRARQSKGLVLGEPVDPEGLSRAPSFGVTRRAVGLVRQRGPMGSVFEPVGYPHSSILTNSGREFAAVTKAVTEDWIDLEDETVPRAVSLPYEFLLAFEGARRVVARWPANQHRR